MSRSSLKLIKVVVSILSSFIGIQSNKNRERDFKSNRPTLFILVGFATTVIFIILLYCLVLIILPS